jgi:hypothetical protein
MYYGGEVGVADETLSEMKKLLALNTYTRCTSFSSKMTTIS